MRSVGVGERATARRPLLNVLIAWAYFRVRAAG